MPRTSTQVRLAAGALSIALIVACNGGSGQPNGDATSVSSSTTSGDESNTSADSSSDTTVGSSGTGTDDSASAPDEAVPCDFDNVELLPSQPVCYRIPVPQDWSNPDSADQIELHVAVFTEPDLAGSADPLVYFDDGPGVNTLDGLHYNFDTLVAPYVGQRDVIIYDQRGVGTSTPTLDCVEVAGFQLAVDEGDVSSGEFNDAASEAVTSCRDRLEREGIDLAAYNTEANANDADAIRDALGYDTWNVLAISYGTRLAQTYMRLYPYSLRSAILDSAIPLEAAPASELPESMKRSLLLVFDACDQDPECSETYPTFGADLLALAKRLADQPANVEVTDLAGNTYTFVVTGRVLSRLLAVALADTSLIGTLPQMTSDALGGDYDLLARMMEAKLVRDGLLSTGAQYSIVCRDEVSFESRDEFEENIPTDPSLAVLIDGAFTFNVFDVCEDWPSGGAPAVENQPVKSDVPALVLTGLFDPAAPPEFGELVAGHLSNSYFFEFPTAGHAVVRSACGTQMAVAFLDDPSREPEANCITDEPGPAWVPDVATDDAINLVEFDTTSPVEISGVRPEGWTGVGPGLFAREASLADPTLLVVQSTDGVSDRALVEQLGDVIGATFESVDATRVDGRSWKTYTATSDTASSGETKVLLMLSPVDDVLVMLTTVPDQFDELVDTVAVPVAASLKMGE